MANILVNEGDEGVAVIHSLTFNQEDNTVTVKTTDGQEVILTKRPSWPRNTQTRESFAPLVNLKKGEIYIDPDRPLK